MKNLKPWAGFMLACLVGLVFEHVHEVSQAVIGAEAVYQRTITTGFRAPIPRYTAIVMISDANEPAGVMLTNVCEQRHFLAKLLTVIAGAKPEAVVIDKFFGRRTCQSNPVGTQALIEAVKLLQERNIPVVVGRLMDGNHTLTESLVFDGGSGGPVAEGNLTMHEDVRRAALRWRTVKESTGAVLPSMDTLSLKAALARTPGLLQQNGRLSGFYSSGTAPFISMLPVSAYEAMTFSAIKTMCGDDAASNADWRSCAAPSARVQTALRNRVVMIGEDSFGIDSHSSPVGDVPGVVLQSMFVEAILDEDLFTPIPSVATYLYGAIVFVFLKIVIKRSPKRAGWWVLGGIAVSYLTTFALGRLGYYLNPGVGVVALGFGLLMQWTESLIERRAGNPTPREVGQR